MKAAVLMAGLLSVLVAAPVAAADARVEVAGPATATAAASAARTTFPTEFSLPDGFQPEGIAISGTSAFFGSRASGAIYRSDLRTGKGRIINRGSGTPSLGLKVDFRGRLFVAGGTGGDARVINARTGKLIARYRLARGESFVNDVLVTHKAAYFTDSTNPVLYKLSFGPGGTLLRGAVRIPLRGAIDYADGINVNGIAPTPDGRALLVVQSNTGKLFRVNPRTGVTTQVDTGGESLANGDGLLLQGRILYVVRNSANKVAVLRLNRRGTSGKVIDELTDPRFDIPTTVAPFRNRLYLPNARFSTTPTPTTPYNVVAIRRH
ncbi:superoxide dismutase [Thermopolyspora sp. NPDC052614]|uniref:SMP-30/gluconolactonase/LRE family protein n=1 Tax=Thermopolyspora sp. NPDC052614 TaxID=3155682 RepID=UPI00341694ED